VTQLYRAQPGARPSSDTDVIIYGSGISVYWTNIDEIVPDRAVVGYVYYVLCTPDGVQLTACHCRSCQGTDRGRSM
jgi:hypothetical protein